MTTPQPGRRRARLASLVLAAALGFTLASAPPSDATSPSPAPATAQPASPASVTLTSADVTTTTLTLAGTVTNASTEPLTDVSVALWRSDALLRSPEAVSAALEAESTPAGTARVASPTNQFVLVGPDDALAPGASRPFSVSGTLAELGLTQTDATWWVGADATGRHGDGRRTALGQARTLATLPEGTVPVARIIEFSAPPRQLKQNLFTDEGLLADITDGRLAELMSVAEGGDSWVVDPSLLLELQDMADGYRVRGTSGSTAGTGAEQASAWLARLDALTANGSRTLFGSPDLDTVSDLGDESLLAAIRSASEDDAADGLDPVTVVTRPDSAALALAGSLGRPVVAVDVPAPHVRIEVDGTRAIVAHSSALPAATSPLLPDTALNRRAARFATARAAGGEVRWVRTPDDIAEASALPHGFRAAGLPEVGAAEPQPWQLPPLSVRTPALDAAHLATVHALRDRMELYGQAAPDAGVGTLVDAQVARAASAWWVGRTDSLDAWLGALSERLDTPGRAIVSLDATQRFTMTGATSEFPVTVTNHLIDPVTIRLEVVSDNPQRIRLVAPDPVTIAPGASSTVLLEAESAGGGVVRASVHAQTVGGHRLTPDREIVVETTNFGTIGWVIVIVSGVVLVATTAHRVRQVRNRRKGEDG
ncbi:hypothetical protein ET989_12040 [Propioniciclava sinopodophylli]|uniref:Secreted protein n=1 Tax=Propioniciclava sinopodophylli TaxID=1837344 RepID=A0A4Q9KBI4_9ACTN|nr:DUF6049 family protein [Propioniciclava sinopodophylli]TBT83200.1 hypothetical protein ET989_12040 [Propioniciclava sinopodophylli]